MHPNKLEFLLVFPPKTHVGWERGRQQAGLIVGSINIIQNATFAEIGVEHQKKVKISKTWKTD